MCCSYRIETSQTALLHRHRKNTRGNIGCQYSLTNQLQPLGICVSVSKSFWLSAYLSVSLINCCTWHLHSQGLVPEQPSPNCLTLSVLLNFLLSVFINEFIVCQVGLITGTNAEPYLHCIAQSTSWWWSFSVLPKPINS